jgi:hypothetical protein
MIGKMVAQVALLLAASAVSMPAAAQEQDWDGVVEYYEPRDEMRELDDKAIAKQRELLNAKRAGNETESARLEKEFNEIQRRRAELVPQVEKYR